MYVRSHREDRYKPLYNPFHCMFVIFDELSNEKLNQRFSSLFQAQQVANKLNQEHAFETYEENNEH